MSASVSNVALRLVSPSDVRAHRGPVVPAEILEGAARIVEEVRSGGEAAVRELAARFDGLSPEAPLALSVEDLETARVGLDPSDLAVLERTRDRIAAFAEAQKSSAVPVRIPVEGGVAGDRIEPVRVAGCYAPGGRYPLPSSVLMTAVTARVAGVEEVWVACPDPAPVVQAAASVAGADGLLVLGGAHAIAALAYGVGPAPPCDVVVGPGNHWVTAAKLLLSGVVGIDLLAGPSELVVLAGSDADADLIAADLLAQAEHDPTAVPILLTTSRTLWAEVNERLADRIQDLPSAEIATESIRGGFAVIEDSEVRLMDCCERLAPEHLQLHGDTAAGWADRLSAFGSLFVGSATAEVFGDYGFGPNHTLPTGGTARFASGLSVFSFLRRPTWLELELPIGPQAVEDVVRLARMEGLEAHARAAEARSPEAP
ncbi:MAG: histidinol dehydrogenase [Gemmatimonadetes bacterium]|nr:histidinol dehydrogenase [Gemmatimonadota bacterium]